MPSTDKIMSSKFRSIVVRVNLHPCAEIISRITHLCTGVRKQDMPTRRGRHREQTRLAEEAEWDTEMQMHPNLLN